MDFAFFLKGQEMMGTDAKSSQNAHAYKFDEKIYIKKLIFDKPTRNLRLPW